MLQWLVELRSAMDKEFGATNPRVMTMATVDRSGAPHARSVVLRRLDDDGRLYVASDTRTEKNAQLRGDRRTELVFWLATSRIQFRIFGESNLISFPEDEPLRKEIWRLLSDEARSTLFWPTPGIAADTDDAFARAVSADVSPPRTFEVLIIEPKQVDRLSLDSHPHRRRVWRADTKWNGVDVNP
jgi:PPOX class probable FMN-dependent enzyme